MVNPSQRLHAGHENDTHESYIADHNHSPANNKRSSDGKNTPDNIRDSEQYDRHNERQLATSNFQMHAVPVEGRFHYTASSFGTISSGI
jgi:hypothetical protein